jgi:hypothetical protein
VGNAGVLANPECLAFFVGWARLTREADGHAVDPPRRL